MFTPLGMTRSTYNVYAVDGAPVTNVAEFYGVDGTPAIHYRFTSLAATSLYTSAADMTRFIQAHVIGPNGEPVGRGVLKPKTLEEMRRPHATQFGLEIWGLGTMLYAGNNTGGWVIGHDGHNDPAINTSARVDPDTGNGIVMLQTGNRLLATTLGGEWLFWRTGNVDFLMVTIEAGTCSRSSWPGGSASCDGRGHRLAIQAQEQLERLERQNGYNSSAPLRIRSTAAVTRFSEKRRSCTEI